MQCSIKNAENMSRVRSVSVPGTLGERGRPSELSGRPTYGERVDDKTAQNKNALHAVLRYDTTRRERSSSFGAELIEQRGASILL
jgi:hypothetical protein